MILFNFDVLARPNKDFGARIPDPDGILLWRAMHEQTLGRVAVTAGMAPSKELVEHWLKINQIKASSYDLVDSDDPKIIADKVQLYLAAAGGRHMYFDINPDVVAITLSMGIPSILVCHPFVVRPEWHSPKSMKSWETLTEEINQQKLARAEKVWGEPE